MLQNINVPNARYILDFHILPDIVLGDNGHDFIRHIIIGKSEFLAKYFSSVYKEVANMQGLDTGLENFFAPEDFDIHICRLDPKGDEVLLSIKMPAEDIDSIICLEHILYVSIPRHTIRHFTIERSSLSDIACIERLGAPKEYVKPFLCELKTDRNRANYGRAPEDEGKLIEKIIKIAQTETE